MPIWTNHGTNRRPKSLQQWIPRDSHAQCGTSASAPAADVNYGGGVDVEEAEAEAQGGERRRMVPFQDRLFYDTLERAQEDCEVQNCHAARPQF